MSERPGDAPGPEDLPRTDTPSYGPDFGSTPPRHMAGAGAQPTWVPERAPDAPKPPDAVIPPPAPGVGAPTGSVGASSFTEPPGATPGLSVKPWQVLTALAVVFVPLLVWFGVSLVDREATPVAEPVTSRTLRPATPSASATSGDRTTLRRPTATASRPTLSVTAPIDPLPSGSATRSSRPVLTNPPSLVPVPPMSITAIPPGAKTIRFEAQAEGGGRIEVSLSDQSHQRFDYQPQKAPLAFEVPVSATPSNNDYFSMRVRAPADANGSRRPDVFCRVLVDGVVLVSQQGQGYVSCYVSPHYDIRRT